MDNLRPIAYSDFSDEGSMYNNINIFILSGFTGGSPRYDLLGKYNKLTNKFNFSDIAYNPEKHDGYLHIDLDDIPKKPRERKEQQRKFHPKLSPHGFFDSRPIGERGGGKYTRKQYSK
jgi:hypothetical protein